MTSAFLVMRNREGDVLLQNKSIRRKKRHGKEKPIRERDVWTYTRSQTCNAGQLTSQ
jgi:hypothetical protein